ncbi:EamA family transporter [Kineococcus sp. SYSU DK006]|uniref:EamA family transporter n=1 Tax=Kineococcus sp. SYSU DK006 TaxID=3383127 RepID=UPI003D7D40EB
MSATTGAGQRTGDRRGDLPAVGMVLGAAASVQVGAGVASSLFASVGPAGAAALRLVVAGLVMLIAVRPRVRSWTRRQWLLSAGFGVSLAAMNTSFYEALSRIPLGVAVTCEFLGPLVLSAVLTHRRRDLLWVGLALAGVAGLGFGGDGAGGSLDPLGVLLALTAGAFWACYVLLSARVGAATPGQSGLAVASAIAALLVTPVGVVTAGADLLHPHVLALGLVVALASSVVPYSLELVALRRLPERTFGVLLSLEPAIAAVVGFLLLSQALPWTSVVAVAVVVAASAGSTASAGRERRRADRDLATRAAGGGG